MQVGQRVQRPTSEERGTVITMTTSGLGIVTWDSGDVTVEQQEDLSVLRRLRGRAS